MNFDEWRNREIHQREGSVFISDGIISPEHWGRLDSRPKLLFLLKEAYGGTSDWDLCADYLSKGPRTSNLWQRVAQWSYGLQRLAQTGEVPLFPGEAEQAAVAEAFLSAAVVNLKKSGGISQSDNEDLGTYVESDWDITLEQILEIAPDLVICGFTYPLFKHKLSAPQRVRPETAEWVYEADGLRFVDFWHPANQFPSKLNFYSLCTVVRMSGVLASFQR